MTTEFTVSENISPDITSPDIPLPDLFTSETDISAEIARRLADYTENCDL